MKRAQDILQRKAMDCRNFVVQFFTAEASLPKSGVLAPKFCHPLMAR